jgi:sporulation protein YqfC
MARRRLRQRLASLLELPGDVVMDEARITLVGARQMMVENHRGVVEFNASRIVLGLPAGSMAVEGEEMAIATISPDQVEIQGRIKAIRYAD